MIDEIVKQASDGRFVVSLLVAIAVIATIITAAMPLMNNDSLARRMKSVASARWPRRRERDFGSSRRSI